MNRKTYSKCLVFLVLAVASWRCEPKDEDDQPLVEAYVPVYATSMASQIKMEEPTTIKNPGKIYIYGGFLLVNEKGKGIHVYDNVDPAHPQPKGFISILGNSDMAVRNDVLYADHMGNIVAIDIDNFQTLTERGSLSIQNWTLGVPPPPQVFFECADPAKGLIVDWKKVTMKKPECYATY